MSHFMKKMSIYLLFFLLFLSVYKDLTVGNYSIGEKKEFTSPATYSPVIKVKAERGDTVLSIAEQLYNKGNNLNINQILDDFIKLNPNVDPYHLKPNTSYYFPKLE